jgi:hypothetical protein
MKKNPTTSRDNNKNLSTLAQLEGITAQQSPYQDDDWSYIEGALYRRYRYDVKVK